MANSALNRPVLTYFMGFHIALLSSTAILCEHSQTFVKFDEIDNKRRLDLQTLFSGVSQREDLFVAPACSSLRI